MSREIWKPIPSAPGWEASDRGRIRKRAGPQKMPNGGTREGQSVAPTFGYLDPRRQRHKCSVNNRTRLVAPLVCEAFHGPRPSPSHDCMHLDETRTNNEASNLAWGTRIENLNAPKFLANCRERMLRSWKEKKCLATS